MEIDLSGGLNIGKKIVKDLRFADDIDILTTKELDLQEQLNSLNESGKEHGLFMNKGKTKVMVMGDKADTELDGEKIECVDQFVYLGSLITSDNDCSKEIGRRIAIAQSSFASLNELWKSGNISIEVKLKLLTTCVFSTLLYACETWTLKQRDIAKLKAFEMRCYRKILKIGWRQKVTNERIRKDLRRGKTIFDVVKERKLGLFGHICRMREERLIKMMVERNRNWKQRVGRPARRWIDDIKEWLGVGEWTAMKMAKERKGFWKA